MFFLTLILLIVIALIVWSIVSSTTGPQYSVIETGRFQVFNTDVCVLLPTCFGQNPDSPYARLIFPEPELKNKTKEELTPADVVSAAGGFYLAPNQAVIIQGISPPKCRYFGFTLYLFSRADGTVPFASLGDTLNQLDIGFNKPFSIIVTANPILAQNIQKQLEGALILPVPADTVLQTDSLIVVLRTAFFARTEAENYLDNLPIAGTKIQAEVQTEVLYTRQPLDPRGTTRSELGYLDQFNSYCLDELKILYRSPSFVSLDEYIPFHPFLEDINYDSGYDCIDNQRECLGDNRDTSYLLTDPVYLGPNQGLVVMGVNHVNTQKAVYISQSLYDFEKQFGITSFSDNDISDLKRFYTFVFSRIPIIGLPVPQYILEDSDVYQVTLAERAYLEPGYHVGTSVDTLIWPRAFLITLRS